MSYEEPDFSVSEAEDFFQLLNSDDQEPIQENLVQFRKPYALCEAEDPGFQLRQRTMRVLNLSDRLRVTEAAIRLFADNDSNKERATAAGQRIVRMFDFLL